MVNTFYVITLIITGLAILGLIVLIPYLISIIVGAFEPTRRLVKRGDVTGMSRHLVTLKKVQLDKIKLLVEALENITLTDPDPAKSRVAALSLARWLAKEPGPEEPLYDSVLSMFLGAPESAIDSDVRSALFNRLHFYWSTVALKPYQKERNTINCQLVQKYLPCEALNYQANTISTLINSAVKANALAQCQQILLAIGAPILTVLDALNDPALPYQNSVMPVLMRLASENAREDLRTSALQKWSLSAEKAQPTESAVTVAEQIFPYIRDAPQLETFAHIVGLWFPKIAPNSPEILRVAHLLQKSGYPEPVLQAIADWKSAIATSLEDWKALVNLSILYQAGERWTEALEALEKAIQINQDLKNNQYVVERLQQLHVNIVKPISQVKEVQVNPNPNPDLDALIANLSSDDRNLSAKAESALYNANQNAVPPLVEVLLHSQNTTARRLSAWIIYKIGRRIMDPKLREMAVSALVESLKDEDAGVRKNAPWGLGLIGGKQVVPALQAAASDPSGDVRDAVEYALRQIGQRA